MIALEFLMIIVCRWDISVKAIKLFVLEIMGILIIFADYDSIKFYYIEKIDV